MTRHLLFSFCNQFVLNPKQGKEVARVKVPSEKPLKGSAGLVQCQAALSCLHLQSSYEERPCLRRTSKAARNIITLISGRGSKRKLHFIFCAVSQSTTWQAVRDKLVNNEALKGGTDSITLQDTVRIETELNTGLRVLFSVPISIRLF